MKKVKGAIRKNKNGWTAKMTLCTWRGSGDAEVYWTKGHPVAINAIRTANRAAKKLGWELDDAWEQRS